MCVGSEGTDCRSGGRPPFARACAGNSALVLCESGTFPFSRYGPVSRFGVDDVLLESDCGVEGAVMAEEEGDAGVL